MKLSKTKKERIQRAVLNHSFSAGKDLINEEAKIICNEFAKKELEKLPDLEPLKRFMSFTSTVYITDGDSYRTCDNYMNVKIDLRLPGLSGWGEHWNVLCKENKKAEKLMKKKLTFEAEYNSAKENIRDVLNSCNTEKQLLKTLPEIKPLIKDIVNTSCEVSLVAVETVEKVKRLLN